MSIPVLLRSDFEAATVRRIAKATKNAAQGRRLLALAEIYDGGTRTDAARIGGVGLQTLRDWVLAFNAEGPDGLIDGKAPGNPSKLNDAQRQALVRVVESGPIPAIHGVVRWRLKDLAWWIYEEFRISLDETTVSRELHKLGYRKLSARPQHHAQNEAVMEDFKKASLPDWRGSKREGKSKPEIIRCLKRYVAREIFGHLCAAPILAKTTLNTRLTNIGASPRKRTISAI